MPAGRPRPRLPPQLEAIRTRTDDWIAAKDPVGKPEADLMTAAAEHDIEVRVIARDGQRFALRADLRPNRVNVEVAGGIVCRVDGVG